MTLRRHDLLRPSVSDWGIVISTHPELAEMPLVADWARMGRPVIVRRRLAGDAPGSIPAAVPLPPLHGKRRIAVSFPAGTTLAALPPVGLQDAAPIAPEQWQPTIAALLQLGATIGATPCVFGALLWQHVTWLPYLSTTSDLDLLWRVPDRRSVTCLLEGLEQLDAEAPVRLDAELELPDGAGVNWRELRAAASDPSRGVLVKTMDVVEFRTANRIFAELAAS